MLFIVISILLTWLLCAAACVGIGSLFLSAFQRFNVSAFQRSSDRSLRTGQIEDSYPLGNDSSLPTFKPSNLSTFQRLSLLDSFWTGFALITGILQLYHFFRPIDSLALILLIALALAGLLWNYSALLQRSNVPTFQRSNALSQPSNLLTFKLANVFLVFLAAALIAFRSAAPTEHYDTGLYGAQAIRWFSTYPLLPGLGNVLGQLGFNSSIFLCMAALNHGPWRDLTHHFFVGFLLAALSASIIPAALRVFRGNRVSYSAPGATENKKVSASDWFPTFLFLPAAIWAATGKLSGANTDLPTTVVCLAASFFLFRALAAAPSPLARHSERSEESLFASPQLSLLIAMLLFSLAVTFKLSSLVFAFTGWLVSFFALCFSPTPQKKRFALAAVILSAAIVLPWICRGLILTGYPFFPSTALGIPVDWKVPAAIAEVQADFARSFARIPQIPLGDTSAFRWLRPWFRELIREREGFLIPLFFVLAGALVAIFKAKRNAFPRWFWLLLPSLAGILFWFFEAPAIRFGEPAIWTAAATLGTFAALHLLDAPVKNRIFLFALLLLTAWAAHPRLLWNSYFRPSIDVRAFLPLPQPQVLPHRTASGLTIYVPVESNQCWDAPLPCSPYFTDTLRLRHPGKIQDGFASGSPAVGSKVR